MQSDFPPIRRKTCYNQAVQPEVYTLFFKRNTKSLAPRRLLR